MVRELAPHISPEEVAEKYEHADFAGFIQSYIWINRLLQTPKDYGLIACRLLQDLHRQNVTYAEINLSVGVMLWKEQDFAGIFKELVAVAAAQPVKVRWIFDAVRHFGEEPAMRVAELAVARQSQGVVAFGVGGDEERGPIEWFNHVFTYVRRHGLHLVPHAGETCGPESIWGALHLGAERIGHGIRAIDDPSLVRYLAERQIPLEVSLTSNLRTGAVKSLREHPVRRLFDAGVPITLNTDDPGIFDTTLEREYGLLAREFAFTPAELDTVRKNAFRFAFLD